MKLARSLLEKDSSGFAKLTVEDKEDLFALYNLVQTGDQIELDTIRNVKKPPRGGGKPDQTERKLLHLTIKVENIDFDPKDESIRFRGRTTTPVDDVPLGSYHTGEVGLRHPFTLHKEDWDDHAFELIQKSCNIENKAEVGAVVLQEGIAHICYITENMTVLRSKVEKNIPKKRRGDSGSHDKALTKFYETVARALLQELKIDTLKAIILASPGFAAKGLFDKIFQMAAINNDKELLKFKPKFLVTHSSTGFLQGLDEVLKSKEVQQQLADTKFAKDVLLLDEFFKCLNADNSKAWYGPKECEKAVNLGAVKNLLLTDSLFRSDNIAERKKYIELSEIVKSSGGEVSVFSTLHESGVQLDQITGCAVILNYPVYDLDEEEDNE